MGIELEVNTDDENVVLSDSELSDVAAKVNQILGYTYTKSDSSVENGFEIVSIPRTGLPFAKRRNGFGPEVYPSRGLTATQTIRWTARCFSRASGILVEDGVEK
jgi:hypothetical protein